MGLDHIFHEQGQKTPGLEGLNYVHVIRLLLTCMYFLL